MCGNFAHAPASIGKSVARPPGRFGTRCGWLLSTPWCSSAAFIEISSYTTLPMHSVNRRQRTASHERVTPGRGVREAALAAGTLQLADLPGGARLEGLGVQELSVRHSVPIRARQHASERRRVALDLGQRDGLGAAREAPHCMHAHTREPGREVPLCAELLLRRALRHVLAPPAAEPCRTQPQRRAWRAAGGGESHLSWCRSVRCRRLARR